MIKWKRKNFGQRVLHNRLIAVWPHQKIIKFHTRKTVQSEDSAVLYLMMHRLRTAHCQRRKYFHCEFGQSRQFYISPCCCSWTDTYTFINQNCVWKMIGSGKTFGGVLCTPMCVDSWAGENYFSTECTLSALVISEGDRHDRRLMT